MAIAILPQNTPHRFRQIVALELKMRYPYLSAFILLFSCSSQEVVTLDAFTKLRIGDSIDRNKAIVIANQFLEAEKKWNIHGYIKIEYFEDRYQKQCNENSMAKQEHGIYCNARYIVSHSSDSYCSGAAMVIEKCQDLQCIYQISEYLEICE